VLTWFKEVILPESSADGTWEKFLDELDELKEARLFNRDKQGEEAADVFISYIAWCFAEGIDLGTEVAAKHLINEGRTWGPPDERGTRRHV
jgi:hypothetical protein